jgi:hypothetical protein
VTHGAEQQLWQGKVAIIRKGHFVCEGGHDTLTGGHNIKTEKALFFEKKNCSGGINSMGATVVR